MDDEQLIAVINTLLDSGASADDIADELEAQGFTADEIMAALADKGGADAFNEATETINNEVDNISTEFDTAKPEVTYEQFMATKRTPERDVKNKALIGLLQSLKSY